MPPMDSRKCHTSNFEARQNHPTTYEESPAFRGPIELDPTSTTTKDFHVRLRNYYEENNLELPTTKLYPLSKSTPTAIILKTIADHLAFRDAPVDVKEVTESMEFYLRTRKRLLGCAKKAFAARKKQKEAIMQPKVVTVYDLCCGHGLTGMLFAACNPPQNEASTQIQTTLVDQTVPPSHNILRNMIAEVCPWTKNNISFVTSSLDAFQNENSDTISIVISTHACGTLTDQVLEFAARIKACGIAVMPCCYTGADKGAPYGVKRALGVAWAADIRRSFCLMEQGYHADFGTIPTEITPMNRIIVGEKKKHT